MGDRGGLRDAALRYVAGVEAEKTTADDGTVRVQRRGEEQRAAMAEQRIHEMLLGRDGPVRDERPPDDDVPAPMVYVCPFAPDVFWTVVYNERGGAAVADIEAVIRESPAAEAAGGVFLEFEGTRPLVPDLSGYHATIIPTRQLQRRSGDLPSWVKAACTGDLGQIAVFLITSWDASLPFDGTSALLPGQVAIVAPCVPWAEIGRLEYAHLRPFLLHADAEVRRRLWTTVAECVLTLQRAAPTTPLFVSTHGVDTGRVHFRIATTPRFYAAPLRRGARAHAPVQ